MKYYFDIFIAIYSIVKKYANVVAEVFCRMYKNMVALQKYLTFGFAVRNKGPQQPGI
jgi:hypothetical protein